MNTSVEKNQNSYNRIRHSPLKMATSTNVPIQTFASERKIDVKNTKYIGSKLKGLRGLQNTKCIEPLIFSLLTFLFSSGNHPT